MGCSKKPPPPPAAEPLKRKFLQETVTNAQESLANRRLAVSALATNQAGAAQLLHWVSLGVLSNDLRPVLTLELAHAPWPNIRSQAWEMLPPYLDKHQQPLPPLGKFFTLQGNPARGATLFKHPDLNCIGCHRLNGEGVALGSDLSDIGLRMDAATLLESLVDPSAIITPGYETWLVVDRDENEHVGVLARETEQVLALRDAKNNEIVISKAQIKQRRQVPVSIMPAGLQQSVTVQDLVDLWLFLRGCRQPSATNAPPTPPAHVSP
ncbi:c-type cytochrome [Fontisphaera persica]|uniref:c-type cytochrome n=1 Tax=Fontisphaera persica TaxID=2974023 RepID=UPI0024BF16EB|nr:c-type cytochrome [Fontisphaera persica]WCJ60785.1 c-type cytochrome [Fontisphaera persica]